MRLEGHWGDAGGVGLPSTWPRRIDPGLVWRKTLGSTRWKMALGFGQAASLLAISSALDCLSTNRLLQDGRRVTHTIEVLATLDGSLSKLFDAESDHRGFLVTGDDDFSARSIPPRSRRTIGSPASAMWEAIQALVASGQGRHVTDAISQLSAQMVAMGRQLLDDRVNRSYLSAQVVYITYAILLILVWVHSDLRLSERIESSANHRSRHRPTRGHRTPT